MADTEPLRAATLNCRRAWWEPLLRAVGNELTRSFMWMFEVVLTDGTKLQAYKHVATRCYMHLDDAGRAYQCGDAGDYLRVPLPVAIARTFAGWEHSGPTDAHAADLKAAVWRARRQEGSA
jgi:hypothetical protein